MTKMERTELQTMANQLTDLFANKDDCFKKLQELSREAGLTVYCSALSNAKQVNTGRAWDLYTKYCEVCGAIDLHSDWMRTLSEVGFCKKGA